MNNSFAQVHIHEETNYKLEIVSSTQDVLSQWASVFIQADKIIGAQFYYSNPILYLLCENPDPDVHARMYGNLYLIDLDKMDDREFETSIAAVNSVFLTSIGSYSEAVPKVISNLKEYFDKYGLYIIGIDIREFADNASKESVSE